MLNQREISTQRLLKKITAIAMVKLLDQIAAYSLHILLQNIFMVISMTERHINGQTHDLQHQKRQNWTTSAYLVRLGIRTET